ncbi:hypothetical protein [Gimesia panareensis]|uniref:hypothetical protein n=1 Tax=Gimesia panareensis TaxID=2527978 RepID=UPI0011886922|nr:hypothetical protein [Gimesia panareensis]QDU50493.1 hypothetical protein Pan110_28440 [Gimesia panareensis]
MDQEAWQKAKDLIDEIEVSVDELLDSPELEGLRSKLAELGKRIGKKYSIDLNCTLEVGEWENDRFLKLIDTGHSVGQNGELYRTWNVASFQRYIVNGEILIVPHDHCPSCWGEWAFEFENQIKQQTFCKFPGPSVSVISIKLSGISCRFPSRR